MSIMNALVTPDRVLVGVDTEADSERQSDKVPKRYEISKLFPLVHANVVMAARGSHAFHMPVLFHLSVSEAATYDAMVTDLSGALVRMVDQAHAAIRCAGASPSFDIGTQEIYLFGWSDQSSRMMGTAFTRDPNSGQWEVLSIDDGVDSGWVAPWGEDWGEYREPQDLEEMQALAHSQVRITRERAPEVAIGGRLIVAELTRESVSIKSTCAL